MDLHSNLSYMDRALMGKYQSVAKRFIVVSNTENDYFVQALKSQSNQEMKILYLKTGKYGKRSTAGDILESDEAKADLDSYLAENDL